MPIDAFIRTLATRELGSLSS